MSYYIILVFPKVIWPERWLVHLVMNLASGHASALTGDTKRMNLLAKLVATSVGFMALLFQQHHLLSDLTCQFIVTVMKSLEYELVHADHTATQRESISLAHNCTVRISKLMTGRAHQLSRVKQSVCKVRRRLSGNDILTLDSKKTFPPLTK